VLFAGILDEEIMLFGEEVKNAVFGMRKYKSENNLSMRTEMGELIVKHSPQLLDWFRQSEKDLKYCANAKKITSIQSDTVMK